MFRQQRDLQVDHEIGRKGGQGLRVDHVPSSEVADPPAAVNDIENDQQKTIHRDHQPVASALVKDFHMLIIIIQPPMS